LKDRAGSDVANTVVRCQNRRVEDAEGTADGGLRAHIHTVAIGLLLALSAAPRARAEDAMKAIDNPGGGKIVYGQVQGQTSEAGTMAAVLRAVHQRFGDRHLTGHVDAQDGKGLKEFNTVFCSGPLLPTGHYTNLAYHTAVPVKFADQERATMGAILTSFSVNQAVVAQETNAIAAPGIAAIHEIGRRAAQQAADIHAREDIHRQSVEQRWDSQDKRNQCRRSRSGALKALISRLTNFGINAIMIIIIFVLKKRHPRTEWGRSQSIALAPLFFGLGPRQDSRLPAGIRNRPLIISCK
jgi:hypothetical protein